MSVTFTKNKRGMSIRATGRDAASLFAAMTTHLPTEQVKHWNQTVKIGQVVEYRSDPYAEPQRFNTICNAEVLSGHTAVVWLEGKSGCVTLDSCTPVQEGGAA
ncbi:MAG: hypothetical protein Q7T62_18210 [Undibacterium sp.]|nr:hypothetical protein [Undibacterium sp.]